MEKEKKVESYDLNLDSINRSSSMTISHTSKKPTLPSPISNSQTMKKTNSILAFFFFFFFLFAFTRADFIMDTNGDRLNNGGTYFIKPLGFFLSVRGASTNGASKSSSSCSLAVVQALSLGNGWPIKITSTYPLKYITNDYPLNITFASLPSNACTNIPNWVVTKIKGVDGSPVMVGKFDDFIFPITGYFYIKPDKTFSGYYKFAFCRDKSTCGYVTLKTDASYNQRLAVSSDTSLKPFLFKFAKASRASVVDDSGISMVV